MTPTKSYRVKFYRGLRMFFQTFLLIIIFAVMVIWALLLVDVSQERSSFIATNTPLDNSLIALLQSNQSTFLSESAAFVLQSDPTRTKVFQITNLAIPELFAFIGLLAVILSDIYWSAVSGLVLFVFWILNHQRFPTLFDSNTYNPSQMLMVVGHALHLVMWSLLLVYASFIMLVLRLKKHKAQLRPDGPQQSPVYCQYGSNYCGYLAPSHLPANSNFTHAPPYYDTFPPPPPTFETIQIRSARVPSNVN